jgi:protein-S-isoprenylcysteine O-methyltransferase Ste14
LPVLESNLIAVAVWTTVWCLGHSWFVSHTWRNLVRRHFPRYHVFSRLVYVIFSLLSLGVLMSWIRTLPEVTLFAWPGWWTWVRWLCLSEAVFLFWLGTRSYDNRSFLGLTQALDYLAGRPTRESPFRAAGILAVVRHPWYTGTLILLIFCLPFTDVNLVWRAVFLIYTLVGTELEERKLLHDFGAGYADYRARVPRFFPDPRTLGRPPQGPESFRDGP